MSIGSISLTVPCCHSSPDLQTRTSCIVRITAVVCGILALLIGAFILRNIPNLQAYGTTAAAATIAVGVAAISAGLFLRSIDGKTSDRNANPNRIYDNRLDWMLSSYEEAPGEDGKVHTTEKKFRTLKEFLASKKEDDTLLQKRLMVELSIPDFSERLVENFGTKDVNLPLPVEIIDGKFDEEQFSDCLGMILISDKEIGNIQISRDSMSSEEFVNLLCLRLKRADLSGTFEPGTLGWVTQFNGPISEYGKFNPNQLCSLFLNPKLLEQQIIEGGVDEECRLVLVDTGAPYLLERIYQIYDALKPEALNRLLPWIFPNHLFKLMQERDDLDFACVTMKRLDKLFLLNPQKMEQVPIKVINQVLPQMSDKLLPKIPDTLLKSQDLDLSSLGEEGIIKMFPELKVSANTTKVKLLNTKNQEHVQQFIQFKV